MIRHPRHDVMNPTQKTGYAAPEDEARALAAGFAAHFQKPGCAALIAHLASAARGS